MNTLILNSAQGKRPHGGDEWVRATYRAVEEIARRRDIRLVCSADPVPWSLVTYLAGVYRIPVLVVMTEAENEPGLRAFRNFLTSYRLDERLTGVRWLASGCTDAVKRRWRERDRLAVGLADIIYPVSIRPGGRHEASLAAVACEVCIGFRVPWRREGHRPEYRLDGRRVNPFPRGEWLVHWTRACAGPWPGEPASAYFRDMLTYPERYVRSAGNTLLRMIRESRIRGSCWRMPGGEATVSFSANGPGDAMRLMRWRKRYVRYSFEPWGIAVDRETLEALGARRVRYAGTPDAGERLFTQSPGVAGDWSPEAEWRLPGDCALDAIPDDRMFAIVPDVAAARVVEARFPAMPCHLLFID